MQCRKPNRECKFCVLQQVATVYEKHARPLTAADRLPRVRIGPYDQLLVL